jgi:ubiquinone/menaquinone biosynthesis C-methylase UbiE
MTPEDARALIEGGAPSTATPAVWADLGCGDGTFTRALATQLAPGSTIHAVDRDAAALRRMTPEHAGVSLVTHRGNFTRLPWPFADLDGVLLANSLHFVDNQPAFIRQCASALKPPKRFLVVEYDTDMISRWTPYPLARRALAGLFVRAGYTSITWLGVRPSIYGRASLYAARLERPTDGEQRT